MPYLVPGHLRLFIWSQIVFYIRTADHFAVGYLSFLQMADFATEAFSLVALLHGHRHGHFHAVCGVPKQIKNIHKKGILYYCMLTSFSELLRKETT